MKTRIYATPAVKGLNRDIINFSFQPLEVASRYRNPQLLVAHICLFKTKHLRILDVQIFKHSIILNSSDLIA